MILLIGDGKARNEEDGGGGGVGVERELFLLLQTMVQSNNDVMQGNKDLMKSVLESSRTIRKQGSAEEKEVENQDIDPSTGDRIDDDDGVDNDDDDVCVYVCLCAHVCPYTHTHTHTHIHTLTHIHTRIQTHVYIHTLTHALSLLLQQCSYCNTHIRTLHLICDN